jgi:excisionase family DNA binding protein
MTKINYMTVKEAAEALDLAHWTVRNLCRLGRLPAKRKRRGWVIPRKFVEGITKENMDFLGEGIPNEAMIKYEKQEEQTK